MNTADESKPRAYTADEERERFLRHMHGCIEYWINENRQPEIQDKMEGLCHSILVYLDGGSDSCPIDLRLSPHPSDKEYYISQGENWQEDGLLINDAGELHDEFYRAKERREAHKSTNP